ncbi:MAG: TIGR04283 family arsenosugar biosynthesis glycosyltransferase [Burkholderiaceae bacterium]
METPLTLSIVMPVLNEAAGVEPTLARLQAMRRRGVQIVVVDGGSSDDTVDRCRPFVDQVITSPKGRARQMNAGAGAARGNVVLFLHADTLLAPQADLQVLNALNRGARWGRFDVAIEGTHWMLPVVAFMMNRRSRLTGIATGDQAIFVQRTLFDQIGGFPDQALMEDIALSARLRQIAAPACLQLRAVTSGRRWESRGVWRTIVLMWQLRWRYWRGDSPECLAKRYR